MFKKLKFISCSLLAGLCMANMHAQAPANSTDVMIQGFYWNSHSETGWTRLNQMAEEIGTYFDLIWLPPSAYAGGGNSNVGYHPAQWSNQGSSWGTADNLKTLIKSLNEAGCKAIADIVINHRGNRSTWCDFYEDNFGSYGTFQFDASHICSDDEINDPNNNSSAGACKNAATGNPDTGDNWAGARDLDHTSSYVQQAVIAYLKWLKEEIGYEGWRYDLVKGFGPEYIKIYNDASQPYLSVGEHWSGLSQITQWLSKIENSSMAFDFPGKYAVFNNTLASVSNGDYSGMKASNNRPEGLISFSSLSQYAVTFVDNHDTYRDGNKYTGDIPQAYAFLLASPGIPCVFWPHWTEYKGHINNMIVARKQMGIHSQSACTITHTSGYYESETTGTCGTLICRIGNLPAENPAGYEKICYGNGWAYYAKKESDACASPDAGILQVSFSPDGGYYPDGITVSLSGEGSYPPFKIYYTIGSQTPTTSSAVYESPLKLEDERVTLNAIIEDSNGNISPVFSETYNRVRNQVVIGVYNTVNWNKVYLYAWNNTGSPLGEWPGTELTQKEGNLYYLTFEDIGDYINIIFNQGDSNDQTVDIENITGHACFEIDATSSSPRKVTAVDCPATNIEKIEIKEEISFYPNPVKDFIQLNKTDISSVSVTSLLGTTYTLQAENGKIDMSSLAPAIYLLTIRDKDEKVYTLKVIKE